MKINSSELFQWIQLYIVFLNLFSKIRKIKFFWVYMKFFLLVVWLLYLHWILCEVYHFWLLSTFQEVMPRWNKSVIILSHHQTVKTKQKNTRTKSAVTQLAFAIMFGLLWSKNKCQIHTYIVLSRHLHTYKNVRTFI